MPFKLNQDRRHHIPKQKHKVTNWREYDASLRQRGSLTVWFTDEAIEAWAAAPRTTRGGQPWYSPLAILTALTLRAMFRLALRQTEGLIGSVIHLLGLALAVPDHSTLSRRAATLEVPRVRSSAGADAEPRGCDSASDARAMSARPEHPAPGGPAGGDGASHSARPSAHHKTGNRPLRTPQPTATSRSRPSRHPTHGDPAPTSRLLAGACDFFHDCAV